MTIVYCTLCTTCLIHVVREHRGQLTALGNVYFLIFYLYLTNKEPTSIARALVVIIEIGKALPKIFDADLRIPGTYIYALNSSILKSHGR